MTMNDPIADFLTRIRNALQRKHPQVSAPASTIKEQLARVLEREGFIQGWENTKDKQQHPCIQLTLKYNAQGEGVIRGLKRISKPGLRQHQGFRDLKPVFNGQGVAIITTSQGLMTDAECRSQKTGGEILCEVW